MRCLVLGAVLLMAAPAAAWDCARKLVWEPNPPHELIRAYRIYRGASPLPVAEVDGGTTEWVIVGLECALPISQCYRFSAVSAWGESQPSDEVCTGGGPSQAGTLRIEEIPDP